MTKDRLPYDRIKNFQAQGADSDPLDERFTEDELAEIRRDFSIRLKSLFPGLTDAQIARRCKVSQSVLKNYLEGGRLPPFDILLQIRRASGCNLHLLMTGEGFRLGSSESSFSEEEENEIRELARRSGRTFDEQVHMLAMGAVELIRKS